MLYSTIMCEMRWFSTAKLGKHLLKKVPVKAIEYHLNQQITDSPMLDIDKRYATYQDSYQLFCPDRFHYFL